MHARGVVFILLILSLVSVSISQTTPFIDQVFVGKCYEKNPTGVNCTNVWDLFSQAAEISNAIVNDTYYDPFFGVADFSTPKDKILFWSGNGAFAFSMSNGNGPHMTIEGTPTGYVINKLSWCGTASNTFDYTNPCNFSSAPGYYGTGGVWERASHYFAVGANGNITILLQPGLLTYGDSSSPFLAYRNSSVFSKVELPSMNPANINSITVLLLVDKTRAPGEICGQGSLANLSDTIKEKFGYYPTCIDNPRAIYETLCPTPTTNTPQCLVATMAYVKAPDSKSSTKKQDSYFIWAIVMTVAFAAAMSIAIYGLVWKQQHSSSNA